MRIERLRLVNFGNYVDTDIQLEQINVFCGPNGAGKSTIKQALEYLLTGRVYGVTDAAGRGADVLVRTGEKTGYVAAVVDGLSISREIGGKLQGMGEPPNREIISALLNTSRFLELPQKEQQALLFSLLGLSFTEEKILDHLNDWPGAGEREKRVFMNLFVGQAAGGPEVFDKLYKLFYNERTSAKRILKELEALAKQEGGQVELPPGAWEAREQIREDLKKLKQRQAELTKAIGQAQMQIKYRQDLESNLGRLEREKQELEEKIKAALPGDTRAEKNYAEGLAEREEELNERIKTTQEELYKVNQKKANLEALILNADKLQERLSSGNKCPLLEDLECPVDRKALIENLKKENDARAKELEECEITVADLEKELEGLGKEIEQIRKKQVEQRQALAELDFDRKKLADLEQRLEYFYTQLEEIKEIPVAEMEEEIDALGQRIANGEELVRKLAVYEDRVNRQRELQERLVRAREEVEALEVLVDAFGPKGIRAKLLDQVIEKLQARADERMQLLTGGRYRVKFAMFAPVIEKEGMPVKKLSTGERLLLGVVMQDILAGLAGARLLVIDDANHLDQRNKNALMGMLLKVREDYDTVMIFSALGEVPPRDPGIPGVAMWYVDGGHVARVPAQAVA
ncbi:MAG: AAA family ATPase [Desulfotomaculales bacterium]